MGLGLGFQHLRIYCHSTHTSSAVWVDDDYLQHTGIELKGVRLMLAEEIGRTMGEKANETWQSYVRVPE